MSRRVQSERGMAYELWEAPIGWLGVVAGDKGVVRIFSCPRRTELLERITVLYPHSRKEKTAALATAVQQLSEYFQGRRRLFTFQLDRGALSPFAAAVSRALVEVPYGQTLTYGELATAAGRAGAARAVGRAMAANPFPLVVPCHRVIGSTGAMTGYSGGRGVETKCWLLAFERAQLEG